MSREGAMKKATFVLEETLLAKVKEIVKAEGMRSVNAFVQEAISDLVKRRRREQLRRALHRDRRYQYSTWVRDMIGPARILRAPGLILILALSIVAAPLSVDAQQPGKVFRIGFLLSGPISERSYLVEAFRQGLRDLGYVEGQNIALVVRSPEREANGSPISRPSWSA
jgi:hypothetical protein